MSIDYYLVDDSRKQALYVGPWSGLMYAVEIDPFSKEPITEAIIRKAEAESSVWLPDIDFVLAWLREAKGPVIAWNDDCGAPWGGEGWTQVDAPGVTRAEFYGPRR